MIYCQDIGFGNYLNWFVDNGKGDSYAKGFRIVNNLNPHSTDQLMHKDSGYREYYVGDYDGYSNNFLRPIIKFNINKLKISLSEDGIYNIN